MKLIYCPYCGNLVSLAIKHRKTTTCECKKCAGKYLSDRITAVFTKDSAIVGIDNNTFETAVKRYYHYKKNPSRVDFFFAGWIPTIPGEVILVDTVQEVRKYPYKMAVEVKKSTMPSSTPIEQLQASKGK